MAQTTSTQKDSLARQVGGEVLAALAKVDDTDGVKAVLDEALEKIEKMIQEKREAVMALNKDVYLLTVLADGLRDSRP